MTSRHATNGRAGREPPLRVVAIVIGAMLVHGCFLAASPEFRSQVTTGPDGLRLFTWIREQDGIPAACPGFALADPVRGTFEGEAGAPEPAWILADDGRRLSVIWPAGFTVRFEPLAALYNELGEPVVRAPQEIVLGQTSWTDASGSYDDPYFAQGAVFGGCYPFSAGRPVVGE